MFWKISSLVVLALTYRVDADCSNVANEDKIDCVQHESWTPQSCVAKGCCYQQVAGFPACYYPFGNKHEARCVMSVGERHDCGDAGTSEIDCIKKNCCWQMTPGAPYCFVAKEGVPTDNPTDATTSTPEETTGTPVTENPTDTTVTDNPVTGETLPPNPVGCTAIKDDDKVDCAGNDPNWTPASCIGKGCCYDEVAGYPACFYNGDQKPTTGSDKPTTSGHTGGKCDVSADSRKECGDSTTTSEECTAKGCCWEINPGSPSCFAKGF